MILLVGGTSETAPLAHALLEGGHQVLVSLATEVGLELPDHPQLEVRRGRLDQDGFRTLIQGRGISRVVDASHPFAEALHRELADVCADLGVPRIRYERPVAEIGPGIEVRDTHDQAAHAAVSHGRPVLLTTGSRNLAPYVAAAVRAGVSLSARILPGSESERACRLASLPVSRIEFARGPFSVDQTRALLRRWGIGVLVAKDGGTASGLAQRLEAARLEGVSVVVVRRPDRESEAAGSFPEIMDRLGVPGDGGAA